ncbi:MAG: hypothetical protein AAF252_10350 [Pseudomonadota bacterium]
MGQRTTRIATAALIAMGLGAVPAGAVTLNYSYSATMTDGGSLTGGFDFDVRTRQTSGLTANLTGGTTPDADTDLINDAGTSQIYAGNAAAPVVNDTPFCP